MYIVLRFALLKNIRQCWEHFLGWLIPFCYVLDSIDIETYNWLRNCLIIEEKIPASYYQQMTKLLRQTGVVLKTPVNNFREIVRGMSVK